ncbi:hypothetical protein ASF66_20800 [Pseudomonas sp. Leaf129]|nr:hypothetical protein ASF66_20800 [Pseudomonas sp. Leaf129]
MVSPQSLAETPAAVLATLIAVKQHILRPATLLIGHIQFLDHQVSVRLGGERSAYDPARIEIDDGRQIVPSAFCTDVRTVTAPDLVGGCHTELSIKYVRDIRSLHGGLFVGMEPGYLLIRFISRINLRTLNHPICMASHAALRLWVNSSFTRLRKITRSASWDRRFRQYAE